MNLFSDHSVPDRKGISPQQVDPALIPFLGSSNDSEAQTLLADLMNTRVEPVLRQALQRRMRLSPGRSGAQSPERNLEDVFADARLNVLRTLRQLKERPGQEPIRNLDGYVRAIAGQAWDQQLRRMFPQRWRLKNQVRYLLSHHPDFGLWETAGGETVAGIAAWKGREPAEPASFGDFTPAASGRKGTDRLVFLLRQIFQDSSAPLGIDALVNLMEKRLGIVYAGCIEDPGDPEVLEQLPERGTGAPQRLEHRIFLRRLWAEILLLPIRQRIAILLGLRDASGHPLTPLLPLLDVATIQEIAECLGLGEDELVSIWNELPMDDRSIAGILHATSQQVINLRKCARQRLGRRLKIQGGTR